MEKANSELVIDYKPIYAYIWKQNPDIKKNIWILFSDLHKIIDSAQLATLTT